MKEDAPAVSNELETPPSKRSKPDLDGDFPPTQIPAVTTPGRSPTTTTPLQRMRNGALIRNVIIVDISPDSSNPNSVQHEKRSRTTFSPGRQTWFRGTPPRWAPPTEAEMSFAENFRLLLATLKKGPGQIHGGVKVNHCAELFRDLYIFRDRFNKIKTESATRLANEIKAFIDQCHTKKADRTLDKPKPEHYVRQHTEFFYFILMNNNDTPAVKTQFERLLSTKRLVDSPATEFHTPTWSENDIDENEASADEIHDQLRTLQREMIQHLSYFDFTSGIRILLAQFIENIKNFIETMEDYSIKLSEALEENIEDMNKHITCLNSVKVAGSPLPLLHRNLGLSNFKKKLSALLIELNTKKTTASKSLSNITEYDQNDIESKLREAGLLAGINYIDALISTINFYEIKQKGDCRWALLLDNLSSHFKNTTKNSIAELSELVRQEIITLLGNNVRTALLTEDFFDYLMSQKIIPEDSDRQDVYEHGCYESVIIEAYALYLRCPPQPYLPEEEYAMKEVAAVAQQTGSPVYASPSSTVKRFKMGIYRFTLLMLQSENEDIFSRMIEAITQAHETYAETKTLPQSFADLIEKFIAEFDTLLAKIPLEENELKESVKKQTTEIRGLLEDISALDTEKQIKTFYDAFCSSAVDEQKEIEADYSKQLSPLRHK